MCSTQVGPPIWVPPFRDVYDLVKFIVFSSASVMFTLYLYHLISLLIGSRGLLKDTFVNDKRALGLIATYIVTTTTVYESVDPYIRCSRFKLDVSIPLIYNTVLAQFFLTTQVLTLLTRKRREAELTGMKRMVAAFVMSMFC